MGVVFTHSAGCWALYCQVGWTEGTERIGPDTGEEGRGGAVGTGPADRGAAMGAGALSGPAGTLSPTLLIE